MNEDKIFTNETFRNTKKMTALFTIDRERHIGTRFVNPDAFWLFTEKSNATIKRDGTAILVDNDGAVFARRSVRKGKKAPEGFRLAEIDRNTGHAFGVEPVEHSGFHKMFEEAMANRNHEILEPGTCELVGPKINGNPENMDKHMLIKHGSERADGLFDMWAMDPEEAYETLLPIFEDFKGRGIEGIVWYGNDGKRVKLRVKDFFGDLNRR